MCLNSALDLWPPDHFAAEFFASQVGRSEMECSALGFSHVRWKPRNGQLAKMRSFYQSKRSDNKQYAVEVRWSVFFRRIFLFLRAVVNIPIQTLIITTMTVIAQDDHLTAGAWTACARDRTEQANPEKYNRHTQQIKNLATQLAVEELLKSICLVQFINTSSKIWFKIFPLTFFVKER